MCSVSRALPDNKGVIDYFSVWHNKTINGLNSDSRFHLPAKVERSKFVNFPRRSHC